MLPRPSRFLARVPALLALAAPLLLVLAPACSNKMEAKECDKIRADAFELVNEAQKCNTDADCRQSEWPGCAKPLSNATFEKIKPMAERYKKGECEEPKVECKEPAPAYCKQGLCAHREPGTPE